MIVDISDDLTVRIHDGTVSWSSSSRMTREAVDRAICTARIKAERRVAELRELQEAMVGARERRTEQDRREKP